MDIRTVARMSRVQVCSAASALLSILVASACSSSARESPSWPTTSAEWFEALPSQRHTLVVDTGEELPIFDTSTATTRRALSEVVSAAPFVRLVAACNARVAAGGGLVLALRVRERHDAPWSPWCALLEWGAAPTVDALHGSFEGGRVAIDELLLERPHMQFQYRVDTRGPVELEHVCVCTSTAVNAASTFDATWRPHGPVALDVPARSQKSLSAELAPRVCSPTSVAMVLHWHGCDVATSAVAERVFDPVHDVYGNWPRNVQGAFELGVSAVLVRYDSWDAVEATLARGLPIVASIGVAPGQLDGAPYTSTPGHLVVVRGFDAHGDVLVVDPAAPPASDTAVSDEAAATEGALRTYRRDQMERVWMERGGTAYVLFRR
jgi:hypothetical protein